MQHVMTLAAFLFLPLFPFSMVVVRLLVGTPLPVRLVLLLAWPQLGVLLAGNAAGSAPEWLVYWVLITSILYAIRVLVVRELNLWIAFLAISSWSLLWLAHQHGVASSTLHLYAVGFSLPLLLLGVMSAALQEQFGAAYAGVVGGLARLVPRLSGVLVFAMLAVVATPPSPAFAAMLGVFRGLVPGNPVAAVVVGAVWLLWTWAAARMLQGLIVGEPRTDYDVADLAPGVAWAYAVVLLVLAVGGLNLIGGLA